MPPLRDGCDANDVENGTVSADIGFWSDQITDSARCQRRYRSHATEERRSRKVKAIERALIALVASQRFGLTLALALPVVSGLLLLVQAMLLAGALDAAIMGDQPLAALWPTIGLFAAVLAVRIGLGWLAESQAVALAEAAKLALRQRVISAALALPTSGDAARSAGALSTSMIEQADAIEGYLARYLPAMVQAGFLPIAFALAVFPVDWIVALIFLVTAPLIPVFMALAGWGAEAASRAQFEALGRLGGRFADRLRGLLTLKLFGRQAAELTEIRDASEELRRRTMRVMRIAFLSSAVLEFFAALGVAGVALYVGLTFLDLVQLRATPLTLQAGFFCLLMAPEIYQPLRLLAAHYHDRAAARAAVDAIAAELGAFPKDRMARPEDTRPALAPGPVRIEATKLALSTPAGAEVLSGGAFSLAAGQTMALLGPSGAGKSTLIEAVARLRPFAGRIAINGEALEHYSEAGFREAVGLIAQRPHIFAGTIADNIRLARPEAPDHLVAQAAARALVSDFADTLPDGMGTRLGEGGLGLSGGEIQRIALARLYLRSPGLILLDEPTAHLDAATEQRVLDGLLDFARGRTLLVATHSAAVARRMQRVLHIRDGLLEEDAP